MRKLALLVGLLAAGCNSSLSTPTDLGSRHDALGTITSLKPTYVPNESIEISWAGAPATPKNWVALAPAGSALFSVLDWSYAGDLSSGSRSFAGLPAGSYVARLFSNDDYNLEAETAFNVDGSSFVLATSRSTFGPWEGVAVNWTGAPSTALDWFSIAPAGSSIFTILAWQYTGGANAGAASFPKLPLGNYVCRYFFNDSYVMAKEVAFTVANTATVSTTKASFSLSEGISVLWDGFVGNQNDWVAIAPAGSAEGAVTTWAYTDGASPGGLTISTRIPVGTYVVRLYPNNGYLRAAESASFTVTDGSTVAADKTTYAADETITVSWTGTSGNAKDWLAIAPAGSSVFTVRAWSYIPGASGALQFSGLGTGSYVARVFSNDSYELVKESASFEVGSSCVSESDVTFCARLGAVCGSLTANDNCGQSRTVASCGTCSGSDACSANMCVCAPESDATFCSRQSAVCGSLTANDNCGQSRTVASCGACSGTDTCIGNQCVCTPESDAVFCSRLGAACGALTANDNCGQSRTVASCGACSGSDVCTANLCVCAPESDVAFCSRLSAVCGSLTANDNCGQSRTVASCGSCGGTESCSNNACVCVPNCAGKACGSDGCGGSCGTCGANLACGADSQCHWSHSVAMTGAATDFNASTEQFTTTSAGYSAYITWDADYVYLGFAGESVSNNNAQHWVQFYLDVDPDQAVGAANGQQFNSQTPAFPAGFRPDFHFYVNGNWSAYMFQYNGTSWAANTTALWDVAGGTGFVELMIARADLGNPTKLGVTALMMNETALSEWTWAGLYSGNFTDGYYASTPLTKYMVATLGGTVAPNDVSNARPSCTPACSGKACGASDGCGGTCQSDCTATLTSQNFDSLPTSGTAPFSLSGWSFSAASAIAYAAGTGTASTGAVYSFGASGSTERALGSVPSNGTGELRYGFCYTNNTGHVLSAVNVSYVGEQWRNGGVTATQSLTVSYSTTVNDLAATAGWTSVSALTFTSPKATTTAGALDGNLSANKEAKTSGIAVTLQPSDRFCIRWVDVNDSGNDHGLAIDDVLITATQQ